MILQTKFFSATSSFFRYRILLGKRKMIRSNQTCSLLLLVAALLVGCSSNNSVSSSGGGTETTNGIIVSAFVEDADGEAAAGADVRARRVYFLADTGATVCNDSTCIDAVTNSQGGFSITIPESTSYRVTVTSGDSALFTDTIPASLNTSVYALDTLALEPAVTLSGLISAQSSWQDFDAYVRVFGFEGVAKAAPDNTYLLGPLPDAIVNLHLLGVTSSNHFAVRYTRSLTGPGVIQLDTLRLTDITSGLDAYWNFDDAGGSTANDVTGNGFDGEIFGASFAGAMHGTGMRFANRSDQVAIVKKLTPSRRGTLALWMRPGDLDSSKIYRIISSDTSSFEISLREGNITSELFAVEQDFLKDTTITLTPSTWYHVACTWDHFTRQSRIYLDGNPVAQDTVADDNPGAIALTFGRSELHGTAFKGMLDDVRIYRRVLTEEQVATLAHGGY
ncbi:MAG: hypothetical protein GF398_02370 [Chitinivibrionales bacterium]|nr:hypothetical protein [Chitinivibrionales bacterium]